MKRLTLDEIGKLAGVSAATVSRVINNYPHVTPERRERVQAVIAQTGFQPNLIARSLASHRTNIIGLVIPNVAHAVFTEFSNVGGWSTTGTAVMIGLSGTIASLAGFDCAVHMCK